MGGTRCTTKLNHIILHTAGQNKSFIPSTRRRPSYIIISGVHLRPGSSVVSADNMAATLRAWDKQPQSFASIKVLESEGSSGSSG
jgi:hypothetical protein